MRVWAQIYIRRALGIICADFFAPSPWMRDFCNLYGLHVRRFFSPDHILDERERTAVCHTFRAGCTHTSADSLTLSLSNCVSAARGSHGCIFIQCGALSQSVLCINHKRSQCILIWKQSDLKKWPLAHCLCVI